MELQLVSLALFLALASFQGKHPVGVLAQSKLQWQKIVPWTSVKPTARRDGALGFDLKRNQLILFGGRSSSSVIFDDTWVFKIINKSWSMVQPTIASGSHIPSARFTIVSGMYNDKFYISTGEGKGKQFFNDVAEFDSNTMKWRMLTPKNANKAPKVRYGASGGIHPSGDSLFVTHGFANTRYSDTFSYDFKTNEWILLHQEINQYDPFGPHARCLQSGTMLSANKMVLFGGCLSGGKTGGPCPAQDSWIFDNEAKKWKELDSCASPRVYSSMAMLPTAVSGGKNVSIAVLYGGMEQNKEVLQVTKAPEDEIIIFDPASSQWSRKTILPDAVYGFPALRSGQMMVTTDEGIMMFGGNKNGGAGRLNDLWLLKGTSASALISPTPGKCQKNLFNLIALHGILMFLGWGVLLQLGAFIARYFRRHDPLWFKIHRIFQVLGLLLAIGGLVCGILSVRFDHIMFPHAIIGVTVMAAGIFQPLNAIIRPHKPDPEFSKSMKRTVWEWLHKITGRLTLVLALANITLGLFLGLASLALWATWLGYLGVIILAYVIAEITLRRNNNRTGSSDIQMTVK